MATLTLDGRPVTVREGATVLDIAREAGVDIPTLCHHEALGPYGACRLCLVEAEGPGLRRGLVTACTLPAAAGLTVETGTPAVLRARRIVLELLLGRSPGSEPLRALARRHGVERTRFGAGRREEACARCGLCVRACRDRIGESAIGFAGRGQARRVTAEFERPSERCVGCGSCAAICPTGAFRLEDAGEERVLTVDGRVVARVALARCERCGGAFAARRHLEALEARLREHPRADGAADCPACRRVRRAAALAAEPPG